jgi:hypothetical protein
MSFWRQSSRPGLILFDKNGRRESRFFHDGRLGNFQLSTFNFDVNINFNFNVNNQNPTPQSSGITLAKRSNTTDLALR